MRRYWRLAGLFLLPLAASGQAARPAKRAVKIDCTKALVDNRIVGTPVPSICLKNEPMPEPTVPRASELADAAACDSLNRQYDQASKDLAANFAHGVGDNSAIRAGVRESQNTTVMEKARLTIELMRGHQCKIPTELPNMQPYLSAALKCETERLNGGNPPSCDMSTWQKD
jgi:hypothetical protein